MLDGRTLRIGSRESLRIEVRAIEKGEEWNRRS
jgi:hypothetical protein